MAVLSLGPVKLALSIQSTTYDDQLNTLMPRAEDYVAARCGPLEPVSVTSRIWGDSCFLVLPKGPLISVTSVTGRYGSVVSASDYYVKSGVLWGNVEFPEDYYDVVYSIGRPVGECPGDLVDAATNIVRHFWRPNLGPTGAGQGDQTAAAMAALRLAQEQMAPYRLRRVAN